MLEEIIKMRHEILNSDRENWKSEEIQNVEKECDELLNIIGKLDKRLVVDVDFLIGNIILTYGQSYFKLGVKDGIKLARGIILGDL